MTKPRILIAGIGNIFLGDDAFGSEVARRLLERERPEEVNVVDFGIRGFDLAYALMEEPDVTVFIDATPRGGEPGTLYAIEPDLSELDAHEAQAAFVEPHGMDPLKVLLLAKTMGAEFKKILVVGCEPSPLESEEGYMGLSAPVAAAVDEAVVMVERLAGKLLEDERRKSASS